MILVTGATGNVGGELVRLLSGAVFLMSGFQDMPGVLAEIRRAGVTHVVQLSGSSATAADTSNAISRYMIASESAVQQSGVPWTILRPSGFMSNALQWAPQLRAGDVVRAPFAGVRIAVVDPLDIAAVAAQALRSDGHESNIYRLSGPESLLPAERLRTLSAVLDRELRFEGQSDAEARTEMSSSMPTEYVDAFFSFYIDLFAAAIAAALSAGCASLPWDSLNDRHLQSQTEGVRDCAAWYRALDERTDDGPCSAGRPPRVESARARPPGRSPP